MNFLSQYVVSGSDDFRVYVWKIPNTCRNTQPFMDKEDKEVNLLPHLILPGHQTTVNHACYSKVHHVLATSGLERITKVRECSLCICTLQGFIWREGNPPLKISNCFIIKFLPRSPLWQKKSLHLVHMKMGSKNCALPFSLIFLCC